MWQVSRQTPSFGWESSASKYGPKSQVREQSEGAVDGLLRHAGQDRLHQLVHLLRAEVAAVVAQGAIDQQALRGHAHPASPQQVAQIGHGVRLA